MKRWFIAVLWFAALVVSGSACAHKASDSYLSLTRDDTGWRGRWDIALRDLDYAVPLDANADGNITWGELRAQRDTILGYAFSRLSATAADTACAPVADDGLRVERHSDGAYAVLQFTLPCTAAPLVVDYRLLFDLDPTHRGLLNATQGGATQTAVFAPERTRIEIGATSRLTTLRQYWNEGVWHIWLGYDHILFLLALLLPAVLSREHGRWRQVASFRAALLDVASVVTAFTVAHSLTLTLAVLGVVSVPSRLVESTIAATVLAAALNNLFPVVNRRRAAVAFVLGLVHGLGFANVLVDLGLPRDALAIALFGFNLGVETGQLAIVTVFLPVAFALRGGWFYRRVALQTGSAAVALVAAVWLIERSLNLRLLPL
jgi:HupE / UreJ protein